MRLISFTVIAVLVASSAGMPSLASATTQSPSEVASLLATLQAKIEALQKELAALRAQRKELLAFKQELRQGMSGDEVRSLQKILATDPSLYPGGLITGFYGPLTATAVSRLQAKLKLESRGVMDEATQAALNALLADLAVSDDGIPPGLLVSGLARIKVESKFNNGKWEYKIEVKCDSSGKGNACKQNDDEDEDTDEDADDDSNELEIEVDIRSISSYVKVEKNNVRDSFTLPLTDKDEIVEALAARLSVSENVVEDAISFEDEDDSDEDEDSDDDSDDDDDDSDSDDD